MRAWRFWLVVVFVMALPGALEATPPLLVPWPCGVTYKVTQGNNNAFSHTGMGAWAFDFGIPVGGSVSAPAPGVVRRIKMDSTTGGCSSDYSGQGNYVVIDFKDGTEVLFLHLLANSSSLRVGEWVYTGQEVGKVGLTGYVCGAHLHFQLQNTCTSYWCQSIKATFVDYGTPAYGTMITSNNCTAPPSCDHALSGGVHVFEETATACFIKATSYWWPVAEGHNGHHYYTFATDKATRETWGQWLFDVDQPGPYLVEVFIPNTEADSHQAVYEIDTGAGIVRSQPVNQATQKGWVPLGVFEFAAGDGRSLVLPDNTGEAYSTYKRKLAYDAIRLTWAPATEPDLVEAVAEAGEDGLDTTADAGGDAASHLEADPVEVLELIENWTAEPDPAQPEDLFTDTTSDDLRDTAPGQGEAAVEGGEPRGSDAPGVCGCRIAAQPRASQRVPTLLLALLALLGLSLRVRNGRRRENRG